ncbi:hypothetical protein KM043_010274 [Ampulex compressa]|nr:hypothetical protein KM043_010274 [Ampulex compressa]
MNISGKVLYTKVRDLHSDLASGITAEILNKICDEPAVQPFLKWFCENVSHTNILSNEEIQMKNKLQNTKEWLSGTELDNALELATQDYPEFLCLIPFNREDVDDLFVECELAKEACKDDEDYIEQLCNSIKNLKELENNLDEEIEQKETMLEKERIEFKKTYKNCATVLTELDQRNHQFYNDVESLSNVYADAAENGVPVLWTQMPIELFIKQMELYNDYLHVHINRQFGNSNNDKDEHMVDSDYASFINDRKDKRMDEKIQELMLCKSNLANSKMEEVNGKVQEKSCAAMLECAREIYNNGHIKVPDQSDLRHELIKLTRKRDFLEENVNLLRERQLHEIVQQFAELETTNILKSNTLARFERRKARLENLKDLLSLVRDHGYVHADLLCILMEMQFRCIKVVAEFIVDARHYLATEYTLSSLRCETMVQQQSKYNALLSSPNGYNSYDKLLISMTFNDEITREPLSAALKKYNDLIIENKNNKHMLDTYLMEKVEKLRILENEINLNYIPEIESEPTPTLKPVAYEINSLYDETVTNVQQLQADVVKIRSKLKERMRVDVDFEREKDILWQRFLADPETLKRNYEEAKEKADHSHFRNTSET